MPPGVETHVGERHLKTAERMGKNAPIMQSIVLEGKWLIREFLHEYLAPEVAVKHAYACCAEALFEAVDIVHFGGTLQPGRQPGL